MIHCCHPPAAASPRTETPDRPGDPRHARPVDYLGSLALLVAEPGNRGQIDLALEGVGHDPVRDPIVPVARLEDRRLEDARGLGVDHGRREVGRIGVQRLLGLQEEGAERGPVVGGRTGHDPVEVVRVALRRHHALAASARAAQKVRVVDVAPVVDPDDRLGRLGGHVDGAMAEVDLAVGVVEGPAGVGAEAAMTGVGPDRGEPAGQYGVRPQEPKRLVLHASHISAAATHEEPAVPVGGEREEEFEVDLGVDRAPDAAVDGVVGGGFHHGHFVQGEAAPGDGCEVFAGRGRGREGRGGVARLTGWTNRVGRVGRGPRGDGAEGHEGGKRSRETDQVNHLPHLGRGS